MSTVPRASTLCLSERGVQNLCAEWSRLIRDKLSTAPLGPGLRQGLSTGERSDGRTDFHRCDVKRLLYIEGSRENRVRGGGGCKRLFCSAL